jgi:hypothetical protein
MIRRSYRNFERKELDQKIDMIDISRNGNTVVTKYNNRIIKTSNVSDRYEVFDIKSYLKSKLDQIEENFKISQYDLTIKGGVQSLTLLSDPIDINGVNFNKSFFILNSTDRSRRLSFNAGLYSKSKNFYVVNSVSNIGLSKKHLKGVTEAAEEATFGLNDETFMQQVEDIQSLVGHKISLSKLKDIIVDEDVKINHNKFDSFKNNILYYQSEGILSLTNDQKNTLRTPSERIQFQRNNDFYVDAFWAFQVYLRIFSNQDSHVIRKETEKIMNMTQWAIRNQQLEMLGI